MSNEEKLKQVFCTVLSLSENEINDDLEYNTISTWDSVGHMKLIAELEDTYGIMMDTDDIIDLSSYGKAKEILKKYDIDF
jgi:acyl carrier protein